MTKSMTSTSESRPEGVVIGHYILYVNSILTVVVFTPCIPILDTVPKCNKSIILLNAEPLAWGIELHIVASELSVVFPSYPGRLVETHLISLKWQISHARNYLQKLLQQAGFYSMCYAESTECGLTNIKTNVEWCGDEAPSMETRNHLCKKAGMI